MSGERREDPARLGERESAVLARARLVALDVDGVLTDGKVVYAGDIEVQAFHVQDGAAFSWLRDAGVRVVWITGRGSAATKRRASELRIDALRTGVRDKAAVLAELQRELGVPREDTIAMGDDLPDLGLAAVSALFVAPANARPEVLQRAGLVTRASGGEGAVRELAERVLCARGAWASVLRRYERAP
jgi:3-deoxy-D-manno-octulosonate 8-phosphate phosphatase (KDO 8-P phosphatase)